MISSNFSFNIEGISNKTEWRGESPASASSFSLIFFNIASSTDRSTSTLMSESCTLTPRTDTPPTNRGKLR